MTDVVQKLWGFFDSNQAAEQHHFAGVGEMVSCEGMSEKRNGPKIARLRQDSGGQALEAVKPGLLTLALLMLAIG